MNVEEARELMNKLNSGVSKASSITAWKSEILDDVDGMPLGVERVDEAEFKLGHVGPASVDDDTDDATTD